MRFNQPPNWPRPAPGWTPPPGWKPPAEWGEPPYGWQLWLPEEPVAAVPPSAPAHHAPAQQPPAQSAPGQRPAPGTEPVAEQNPDDAPDKRRSRWGRATKKAVENPLWTTLGAIVGIVGLVISVFQIYQATKTPPVDLEVASITIDGQQAVAAQIFPGPTDANPTDGTVELTPIDITLQNKGGDPSLITRIDAEVVFFAQLQDCTGTKPAPERAAAQYQLKIPMNGAEPSTTKFGNEVRFEVKPDAADRMVLTIGPDVQAAFVSTPMVMTVKLAFVHDDDQRKEIGAVSLVTTVAAANAQISGIQQNPAGRECAKNNVERLDNMFAIQATRSRLLEQLRSAYQAAAG